MLNESRLFTFIDQRNEFVIHFLEGQKLIHDLTLTHDLKASSLQFFRDTVLTSQMLLTFLKPKEALGFFIDSEEPYLRFKIEMNHEGLMRTLLLPKEFSELPKVISSGKGRLTKILPNQAAPYSSIVDINNSSVGEVVNSILKSSYQTNSVIHLSQDSDQSLMITKIPRKNIDKEESTPEITMQDYVKNKLPILLDIAAKGINEESEVITEFTNQNLEYLKSIQIQFSCSCSKERMISGVSSLTFQNSLDNIFQDQTQLDINCDYCTASYQITKEDVMSFLVKK